MSETRPINYESLRKGFYKIDPHGLLKKPIKKIWGQNAANSVRYKAYLNTIKTFHGCMMCGYNEHAQALDFHHTDSRDKEFMLSNAISIDGIDDEILMKEINKCAVLCANCHRVIHAFMGTKGY